MLTNASTIQLTRGLVTIVDESDLPLLSTVMWSVAGSTKPYARSAPLGYLHRFLARAPAGLVVDHINGDSLDNRRANLRLATGSQNHANRKVGVGASRYKGVSRARSLWRARVSLRTGEIDLGRFLTQEDAAAAYDARLREMFGEFAATNFPEPRAFQLARSVIGTGRSCPICSAPIELKATGRPRVYCSSQCLERSRAR